ncbi:hypothetical protein [Rhodoferax lacus]|uniref:hypothetical protein n=1 Tax=Rhodoferax lacus TaxID=2184758 RepID=UPI0013140E81|nr:hypothetical protein [Rhodoferax lacus]
MPFSTASRHTRPTSAPLEANPFDKEEVLPGLGIAVLWVVLSYVFVSLLMLPVHPV